MSPRALPTAVRDPHISDRDSALRPASHLLVLHHARRGDGAQDDRRARGEARLPGDRADRPQRALRRDAVQRRLHRQGRAADHRRDAGRRPAAGDRRRSRIDWLVAAGEGRAGLCQPLQAGVVGAPRSPGRGGAARPVRHARRPQRGADRADRRRRGRACAADRRRAARQGRGLSRSAAGACFPSGSTSRSVAAATASRKRPKRR